jgi:hypothetical protein
VVVVVVVVVVHHHRMLHHLPLPEAAIAFVITTILHCLPPGHRQPFHPFCAQPTLLSRFWFTLPFLDELHAKILPAKILPAKMLPATVLSAKILPAKILPAKMLPARMLPATCFELQNYRLNLEPKWLQKNMN